MSELPAGWTDTRIGDLCVLRNGRAFKPSEWKLRGLPIVRIQNLKDRSAPFNYFDDPIEDRFSLKGGELLFAWSGTPGTSFGAHIWDRGPAVLNQHIFRIDFDERAIDKRFFRYAINHKIDELVDVAHGGVGLGHVTKGVFESTRVLLPPRSEQVRIADKLDSISARLESSRERLERVPELLKRFREAVLEAALSGRLTPEWRERSHLSFPSTPDLVELATLCSNDRVITYGVIKLGDPAPGGVPCLRTSNVRWLYLDVDGMKLIDPELSAEYSRTVLRGSEVLVNVRGTLGGVVAVTPDMRGWNVSREVAVVPVDTTRVNPKFLALWIASNRSQRWLQCVEKGVAYTGINIEDLRNLPVAVPSSSEQAEIVRRVAHLFALADRCEQAHRTALLRVETLHRAILHKAFQGKLVPQDPGEETVRIVSAEISCQRREFRERPLSTRGRIQKGRVSRSQREKRKPSRARSY